MAQTDYQPQHFKPGTAPAPHGGGLIIVYGEPGVGKTQFCIDTADVSTPLWYSNFDRDAAHLLKKYKGEGGIYYQDFMALTKAQAETCLEKLEGMKNAAMSAGKGVFVLDNFAHCYEIVQLAKLDQSKSGPLGYGPVNLWLRDFMLGLERAGVWCLITAPAKEIWITVTNPNTGNKTGQATGLYDPDGWKHADYHIIGSVWLYTNQPIGAERQPKSTPSSGDTEMPVNYPETVYKAQIVESKKRPSAKGMIIKSPTLAKVLKLMGEGP